MTALKQKAWLGLGGNIGDPVTSMAKALRALNERSETRVLGVSPVYKTPPWGKTDQAWFHNACAEVETSLDPEALLAACLDVEKHLKRQRLERWGPRIIDIDVLAYEGLEEFESPTLDLATSAHDRARLRDGAARRYRAGFGDQRQDRR